MLHEDLRFVIIATIALMMAIVLASMLTAVLVVLVLVIVALIVLILVVGICGLRLMAIAVVVMALVTRHDDGQTLGYPALLPFSIVSQQPDRNGSQDATGRSCHLDNGIYKHAEQISTYSFNENSMRNLPQLSPWDQVAD